MNDIHMAIRNVIRHSKRVEPIVWIVDSQQWPRACLRAELIERGYTARGFVTLEDALVVLSQHTSPKPDAIVVNLRNQNFTTAMLETVRSLNIPTILLGGTAELNDPMIQILQLSAIMKRPVSLGAIADRVEQMTSAFRRER
jgi:DNA-binding NtrC family response regulator